jgi:hypothetical protein
MTTREELLRAKVQHLLSTLSDHSTVHLLGAETDLAQTNLLLSEAIDKLSASFMAIHEAVTEQQVAIDHIMAGAAPTPEIVDALKSSQARVASNVHSAVTGLQFQDMTSQLIGRTIRRVNGLHDVMKVLGSNSVHMHPANEADETILLVDNVSKVLEDQTRELETMLRKAVSQTHMESGGIDLF